MNIENQDVSRTTPSVTNEEDVEYEEEFEIEIRT